jgi:hypothetical protein
MRVFARKKAGVSDARLHEHDEVRDIVARLLVAAEVETASGGVAFLFSSLRSKQGTSTIAAAVARCLADSGRETILAVVAEAPGESDLPGSVALKEFFDSRQTAAFPQPPLLTVRVPPRFTDLPESAHNPRTWLSASHILIVDAPTLTHGLTRYWVPRVHGVVLVIDGEEVPIRAVVQGREDVQRLGGRLVGVVLNRYRSRIPAWIARYFVYG